MCRTIATCLRYVIGRRLSNGLAAARTRPAQTANKAIQIMQKLVEEYPDVPDYSYDLSETYAIEAARSPFSSEAGDCAGGRTFLSAPSRPPRRRRTRPPGSARARCSKKPWPYPRNSWRNIPTFRIMRPRRFSFACALAGIIQESDQAGAESNYRKALDLQSSLVRRYPKTSSYKFGMAMIYESLAGLLEARGVLPEARSMLQDSIASLKELSQSDPKGPPISGILAHNYMSLADLLRRMGEDQAAADADAQARDLRPGP